MFQGYECVILLVVVLVIEITLCI